MTTTFSLFSNDNFAQVMQQQPKKEYFLTSHITIALRNVRDISQYMGESAATCFMAMHHINRFCIMESSKLVPSDSTLIALAAVSLACKFVEDLPFRMDNYLTVAYNMSLPHSDLITKKKLVSMEARMASALDYQLGPQTVINALVKDYEDTDYSLVNPSKWANSPIINILLDFHINDVRSFTFSPDVQMRAAYQLVFDYIEIKSTPEVEKCIQYMRALDNKFCR